MLSVFFNKSKPIHYVVLGILLLVIFTVSRLNVQVQGLDTLWILKQLGVFIALIISVFVFDFFVTKNKLTQKNSFKMLLFLVFVAILPETLMNAKIVLANLFLIFALRRMLSLRTHRDVKKKLFDAAFWVAAASLLYFWCIVFFILIYVALLVYSFSEIKNYLIPLVGLATVGIIVVCYRILMNIEILNGLKTFTAYSLDFSSLNSKRIIIGTTVLFSLGLWSLFYYLRNIKSKMKSHRPTFKLIVFNLILCLFVIAVAPSKNGSEFIFLFTPLAIIITNYLEIISEKWFKESFLWLLVVTPFVILVL